MDNIRMHNARCIAVPIFAALKLENSICRILFGL